MNVLGISAYYHTSSACILADGTLLAAAEEERFTRVKHDAAFPVNAVRFCLNEANISISDIDVVAYYENPELKMSRQLAVAAIAGGFPAEGAKRVCPGRAARDISEVLGFSGHVEYVDHHLAHAASAVYYSGIAGEAAVLVVDAVGEWETTSLGIARGGMIDFVSQCQFPHSIGLFYSAITTYLGFRVNDGEYKVMGLAAFGKPRFQRQLSSILYMKDSANFELDMSYFDFYSGKRMFSSKLEHLLGQIARKPDDILQDFHADVACSAQSVIEDILLNLVRLLETLTESKSLCMAGGVALNCVANARIRKESSFTDIFIQPAAGDSGGALGAAAIAYQRSNDLKMPRTRLSNALLGPQFDDSKTNAVVAAIGINIEECHFPSDYVSETCTRLADGKILGWFQGRMEFGPRALGARSIIADPRRPGINETINRAIKRREPFRPFAPMVMEEFANLYFDCSSPLPFMLETCYVLPERALPAVTHVDGTARVQTVSRGSNTYDLLKCFAAMTGCNVLLNTSFNMKDEPIVCTPEDAMICFARSGLDALTIGKLVVDREKLPLGFIDYANAKIRSEPVGISETLYTFL